ncbi:MAG: hypothetical protein IPJ03_17325 [Ignavibacteriales bacterium]|nr:hypothetical protein [Ignavibacteriales bacterium]
MPYLSSRLVEVGFVWNTATTEAEITWHNTFYVDGYSYAFNQIILELIEFSEIESVTLPFYKVQKEYDDGISYTLSSSEEVYGSPIPIVYGVFTTTNFETSDVSLAPTVLMNKNLTTVKIASHKCLGTVYGDYTHDATDRYYLFKGISEGNYYVVIYTAGTTGTNNEQGHSITLLGTPVVGYVITGYARIPLTQISGQSDVDDVTNATDKSATTYTDLDANGGGTNKIALRIAYPISSGDVGTLSTASVNDVRQVWAVASNDANVRAFTTYFYNVNGIQAGSGGGTPEQTGDGHSSTVTGTTITEKQLGGFARQTTATTDNPNLPHRIDDLSTYDYVLRNDETSVGNIIRVAYGYLELSEILISGTLNIFASTHKNIYPLLVKK